MSWVILCFIYAVVSGYYIGRAVTVRGGGVSSVMACALLNGVGVAPLPGGPMPLVGAGLGLSAVAIVVASTWGKS